MTIIIPTHNRKEYLKEALRSIRNQTYPNIEIIVVDEGSSDGTRKFLNSLNEKKIQVIRHDIPKGQSCARNKGIEEANGEYILFLDDDDMLHEDAVSTMTETIEAKDENCAAVFAASKRFGEEDRIDSIRGGKYEDTSNLDFGASCSMFRLKILKEFEGFKENLEASEDLELIIRIFSNSYYIYGIDKPLYQRRIHGNQISKNYRNSILANYEILDKHSQRLSALEKIEWYAMISWNYKQLGEYNLASDSAKCCIKVIESSIDQLDKKEAYHCFKRTLDAYERFMSEKFITSELENYLDMLNRYKDQLKKKHLLYGKLGTIFAEYECSKKARECFNAPTKRSPFEIFIRDYKGRFGEKNLMYGHLGVKFADYGKSRKARECFKESIKRNPSEIYTYYFYFWLLFGEKGYRAGRKMESIIKKDV